MRTETAFFDIDTQFDFMRPRGALYVRGASAITARLRRLTRLADRCRIPVISSLDRHTRNDPEFARFPPHCVRGSRGQKKIAETIAGVTRQTGISKCTLDVFANPRTGKVLRRFDRVYVYGVALDYCVKAACLGAVKRGLQTYLVTDATVAVSRLAGRQTLRLLRRKKVIFTTVNAVEKEFLPCRKTLKSS